MLFLSKTVWNRDVMTSNNMIQAFNYMSTHNNRKPPKLVIPTPPSWSWYITIVTTYAISITSSHFLQVSDIFFMTWNICTKSPFLSFILNSNPLNLILIWSQINYPLVLIFALNWPQISFLFRPNFIITFSKFHFHFFLKNSNFFWISSE